MFSPFQWVFLPDPATRQKLVLPPAVRVDYRAACFCHRELIDIGYVCSVCLSSEEDFVFRDNRDLVNSGFSFSILQIQSDLHYLPVSRVDKDVQCPSVNQFL